MLRLASLLLFPAIARLAIADCYYPNGKLTEEDHFPCPSADGKSAICCADGFQCLGNGLCGDYRYPDFGRLLRGGCTDKSWGKDCGTVCNRLWPDRDEHVLYCGDGKYCCDGDDCCTRKGAKLEQLAEPSIVGYAGAQNTAPSQTKSTKETETPSPTTAASDGEQPPETKSKNTTAIGVGVGVGVGAFLIGLLGLFIFLRRRKQRRSKSARAPITERSMDENDPAQPPEYEYKVGGSDTKGQPKNAAELGVDRIHELPATTDPKDLGIVELGQNRQSKHWA